MTLNNYLLVLLVETSHYKGEIGKDRAAKYGWIHAHSNSPKHIQENIFLYIFIYDLTNSDWYRQLHIYYLVFVFTATCTIPNTGLIIPEYVIFILLNILILKCNVVMEDLSRSQTFLVASMDCCCRLMDGDLPLTTLPLSVQPIRTQMLWIRYSDWPIPLFAITNTRLMINYKFYSAKYYLQFDKMIKTLSIH